MTAVVGGFVFLVLGLNEFQPLIDFEGKLGFNSHRNFIEEK